MNTPTWVAVLTMGVGLLCVLRAAVIVAVGGNGRFRFDPWISLILGSCLILIGQYLLRH